MAFRAVALLSCLVAAANAQAKPLTVAEKVGIGIGAAAGAAAIGSMVALEPKAKPELNAKRGGAKAKEAVATEAPVVTTAAPTPWDSSSGSSDSLGASSASLTSASMDSLTSDDSSGSQGSSGSTASGSSGFYMPIIAWVLLLAVLLCCVAAAAGAGKKKKRATKKKKSAPSPAPAAAEEPAFEIAPLLPALMPLATTSYAAPMTYAPQQYVEYAQPAQQYVEYAQPAVTYAAPAMGTMTYVAPQAPIVMEMAAAPTTFAAPTYIVQ